MTGGVGEERQPGVGPKPVGVVRWRRDSPMGERVPDLGDRAGDEEHTGVGMDIQTKSQSQFSVHPAEAVASQRRVQVRPDGLRALQVAPGGAGDVEGVVLPGVTSFPSARVGRRRSRRRRGRQRENHRSSERRDRLRLVATCLSSVSWVMECTPLVAARTASAARLPRASMVTAGSRHLFLAQPGRPAGYGHGQGAL